MIPNFPKGFSHPMRIGTGAFASVYRVRQNALDRWVAVKVLDEKDPVRKREIVKEATTQARIKTDCIPQVYHVMEWRGRLWVVMEWIRGIALNAILARLPSKAQRLRLADGCIRSLACLHGLGFAHRDLKPANVIISPDKGAVLVDFGFAKHVVDGQESLAGVVRGTPAYMAPELWMGKTGVDPMRADVFALGRVLRDILPDGPNENLIARCCDDVASRRPADAREVIALWEKSAKELGTADWAGMSREASAQYLSERLVAAARILLGKGRQDEAYWLLVESIEENPANADAVSLMNSFPTYVATKKKRQRLTYAALIALSACLLLLAFGIGRTSREWDGTGAAEALQRRDMQDRYAVVAHSLHRGLPENHDKENIPLHDVASTLTGMQGTIFIASHPLKGSLLVDGESTPQPRGLPGGVMLPYGRHTLAWVGDDGRTVWRQTINLLPFETKIVSSAERTGSGRIP